MQSKRQTKQQVKAERLKRIDEIYDFCSSLIEKSKKVYKITVTGQAVQYFSEIENFLLDHPPHSADLKLYIGFTMLIILAVGVIWRTMSSISL